MRNFRRVATATLVSLFIISACQKESNAPQAVNIQPSVLKGNFKKLYEQQRPNNRRNDVLGTGSPDWEKIQLESSNGFLFTEMDLDFEKAKKYLVGETDKTGAITRLSFYIIIGEAAEIDPAVVITNTKAGNKRIPGSFTGAVLKYSLSNELIFGKDFNQGQQTNKSTRLEQKAPQNTTTYNPPPPQCTGEWITTDWWLATFDDDGNLISYDYLYTTSYCTEWEGGGGGGGGNGNGNSGCEEITGEQIMAQVVANGEVKSEAQTITILSETSTTRNIAYPWMIFKNFSPGFCSLGAYDYTFISNEIGTHFKGTDNKWHWQSLIHGSINRFGYGFGLEMTCEDVTAISNIFTTSSGEECASMSLNFGIQTSLIIDGLSIVHDEGYTTSHIWKILNPIEE